MFASVFAVILLAGLTSAASLADITVYTIPASTTHNAGSFTITFNLTNSGVASTLDYTASTITSGTATLSFNDANIADGSVAPVTETITATVTFGAHQSGNIAGTIVVTPTAGSAKTLAFSVPITSSSSLTVSTGSITKSTNSTTLTITNTGNTVLTNIALNSTGSFPLTFSSGTLTVASNSIASLSAGASGTIQVTATSTALEDLIDGSSTVTATSGSTTASGKVTLSSAYCEYNNLGSDLKLDVSFDNVEGFGDDTEWYAFDEIEAEITVENNGDYKISDIKVEWGLYNAETGEWVIDDSEKTFDLKDDEEETLTVSFQLDENLDELADGDFTFYVRATGEFDDSDSANDGDNTCVSSADSIDVMSDDFVILDNVEFTGTVSCGSEVQITADVWNIGDDDLDEVSVLIYNQELGINKEVLIGDIDSFDKEKLDITITLPENAVEKTYSIRFQIYDEDDDIFENENDDKAQFTGPLVVSGSCSSNGSTGTGKAAVSANLVSGGKAGKSLVIKSTITNTGLELATYSINAAGYASWANSAELDSSVVVLTAGASKDVEFTFDVKKDASGSNSFDIEVLSGNQLVVKQPVTVSIDKSSFFSGFTGNVIGEGSGWYLWAIGAINVILVIVIIIVALRIAKS